MIHYVCTGGCGGVAQKPGLCETEICPKHGKPLTECNCADGQHAPAFEKDQVPQDK